MTLPSRRSGRRSLWPAGLVLGAIGLLAALGMAVDVCAHLRTSAPHLTRAVAGSGVLRAGAAAVSFEIAWPQPVIGYGAPRPEVYRASAPLKARALVLATGELRVGVVTLDLLLADAGLANAIQRAAADLSLSGLWVAATHSHSSVGGTSDSWLVQLAATGREDGRVRAAVVQAAASALHRAAATLVPVRSTTGAAELPELVGSRNEIRSVDARLTRIALDASGGPVAQLIVFACHPTLVVRPPPGADPDWPGRLAETEEERGRGVTLVLQGNVGNASSALPDGPRPKLERFLERLTRAVESLPMHAITGPLGIAEVELGVPAPDLQRLVPRWTARAADNLVCPVAPRTARLSLLTLGGLRLLGVPGEPTAEAGRVLETAARADRSVSLVDGYLGYFEMPDVVRRDGGESRRQLLGPDALDTLVRAAHLF